ncbi:uncharacterized protein SPSK_08152 [Sporothrix schenckii 1099-18]|uniref:Uncharacterized protein n=1 Tax=Sporothrix schenckii 1099-18 TaxID=1397361 RepID=A0A0F2MFN7_SPOSC|nr:uncharacterized protein SPSK_08152 [Sporothrix schenckii 1099-18]KJR88432.1 hypothetical protein SPSK_08152 [Sporothrix schenckii 1099-18]
MYDVRCDTLAKYVKGGAAEGDQRRQNGGHGGVLCSTHETRRQTIRRRGSVSAKLLLLTPMPIDTPPNLCRPYAQESHFEDHKLRPGLSQVGQKPQDTGTTA